MNGCKEERPTSRDLLTGAAIRLLVSCKLTGLLLRLWSFSPSGSARRGTSGTPAAVVGCVGGTGNPSVLVAEQP